MNKRHRTQLVAFLSWTSLGLVDSSSVDFFLHGMLADQTSEEGYGGTFELAEY
jgi:hypothetical protein